MKIMDSIFYKEIIFRRKKNQCHNGFYYTHDIGKFRAQHSFFRELGDLYHDYSMNVDEFREWFEDNACTEWNKQTPDGEYFGGHWETENDRGMTGREVKYASDQTKKDNINALVRLPFSYKLIRKTILIGCGNRRESVAYSSFLCEVIKEYVGINEKERQMRINKIKNRFIKYMNEIYNEVTIRPTNGGTNRGYIKARKEFEMLQGKYFN